MIIKNINKKVALFIPTYNAIKTCGDVYTQSLKIIQDAHLDKVLIIDSSSSDDTVAVTQSFGFECRVINQKDFDHSGTRKLALELLGSDVDIIIYLTQDALLQDITSLEKLIQPLVNNENVAGVYGRQLPHLSADIYAKHLRVFNYTDTSYIRNYNDRYVYGMKCVFTSDSFAAYNVSALKAVGGFPEHLIFGEDAYIFAKLLQGKYFVAYEASAICYHSHNYKIGNMFSRYFDIGVFHRTENWILNDFGYPSKHGIKYALSELKFLSYRVWLWPKSIIKSLAKYAGYKLGYNFDRIGVILCRKFSMNKSFWW